MKFFVFSTFFSCALSRDYLYLHAKNCFLICMSKLNSLTGIVSKRFAPIQIQNKLMTEFATFGNIVASLYLVNMKRW